MNDKPVNGHDAAPGMEFPCTVSVKVFVEAGRDLEKTVRQLVLEVIRADDYLGVSIRDSRNGKYQSLSCKVLAHDRETLDRLFTHLSQHPDILMVL